MGQQELPRAISLNHALDMPTITKATYRVVAILKFCRLNSVTGVESSFPEGHINQGVFVEQEDVRREACARKTNRSILDGAC